MSIDFQVVKHRDLQDFGQFQEWLDAPAKRTPLPTRITGRSAD